MMSENLPANVVRFSGFADTYDQYRPSPPAVMVDVLTQLARVSRAGLVVDIGSGTGLSTRIWSGRAERIVGIEPNPDMRRQAQVEAQKLGLVGIVNLEGTSTRTGLADCTADVVTCVQSLHWMEPEPTFAEIARILRPGGIFAACDCDWPPTMNWEAEAAYSAFMSAAHEMEIRLGVSVGVEHCRKEQHLERIKASGHFRFAKEITFHQVESGNAQRLVGLAKSQGGVATLTKHGLTQQEIGLTKLQDAAVRTLGSEPSPWYFSYRVRIGIK